MKIKCQICDSSDIIKTNGVFICQNCGVKYSPEEVKSLLFDDSKEDKEVNKDSNLPYYVKVEPIGNSEYKHYSVDFASLGGIPKTLDEKEMSTMFDEKYHSENIVKIDLNKILSYELNDDDVVDEQGIYKEDEDENFKYVVVIATTNYRNEPIEFLNDYISDVNMFFRCEWYEELNEDGEMEDNGIIVYDEYDEEFCRCNYCYDPELDGTEGEEYIDYLNAIAIKESPKTCFAHLVEYSWEIVGCASLTFKVAIPKH